MRRGGPETQSARQRYTDSRLARTRPMRPYTYIYIRAPIWPLFVLLRAGRCSRRANNTVLALGAKTMLKK